MSRSVLQSGSTLSPPSTGAITDAQLPVTAQAATLSSTYLTYGHSDVSGTQTAPHIEIGNESNQSTLHLLAGVGASGPYLIGLGVDHDSSPTGLVASVKGNSSIGIDTTLETTSGPLSTGFLGQNFAGGTLMQLVEGSTATGPNLDLRNDYGGTGNLLQWGVGAGTLAGYVGAAGDFVVQSGTSANRNFMRLAPSSGGNNQIYYQYTGSAGLWFSSSLSTTSNGLFFKSGAGAAAIGSEVLNTLFEIQNGNSIGFYGVAPVTRAAAITTPSAPSATYVQAEAQAMKTAVDAIRVALTNIGITA